MRNQIEKYPWIVILVTGAAFLGALYLALFWWSPIGSKNITKAESVYSENAKLISAGEYAPLKGGPLLSSKTTIIGSFPVQELISLELLITLRYSGESIVNESIEIQILDGGIRILEPSEDDLRKIAQDEFHYRSLSNGLKALREKKEITLKMYRSLESDIMMWSEEELLKVNLKRKDLLKNPGKFCSSEYEYAGTLYCLESASHFQRTYYGLTGVKGLSFQIPVKSDILLTVRKEGTLLGYTTKIFINLKSFTILKP